MRPKIDRRRLFSSVGTVASTDGSTINAYKAALLPLRLLQCRSASTRLKAESVPNFYQVQTLGRRNETRPISASRFQPGDDVVHVHFLQRNLCHCSDHQPDHFVKEAVTRDVN